MIAFNDNDSNNHMHNFADQGWSEKHDGTKRDGRAYGAPRQPAR